MAANNSTARRVDSALLHVRINALHAAVAHHTAPAKGTGYSSPSAGSILRTAQQYEDWLLAEGNTDRRPS